MTAGKNFPFGDIARLEVKKWSAGYHFQWFSNKTKQRRSEIQYTWSASEKVMMS